jgi:hypothetical protein
MAEKSLWRMLRDQTKRYGHFDRIENMVGRGMPDVTYCVRSREGFIELKQIPEWPVRAETVVSIEHYTPQQRNWARTRMSAGGRVYLLLGVVRPTGYLLFHAHWALTHLAIDATQEHCWRAALVSEERRFPTQQLIEELTRG